MTERATVPQDCYGKLGRDVSDPAIDADPANEPRHPLDPAARRRKIPAMYRLPVRILRISGPALV
jgi:hypothetical protein